MSSIPSIGIPFATVPPIFLAQGEGVFQLKDKKYREFKHALRSIHKQIEDLSPTKSSEQLTRNLNALKQMCSDTLLSESKNHRPENKKGLCQLVKSLKEEIDFESTCKKLDQIKSSLLSISLHSPKPEVTTPEGTSRFTHETINRIEELLENFDRIKEKFEGTTIQVRSAYQKISSEMERLRYNIDLYDSNPRISEEAEEHTVIRCNGMVDGKLMHYSLDKSDAKQKEWSERFKTLNEEWNQLAIQIAEINAYKDAINAIRPILFDLFSSKFKLELINQKIAHMLNAYDRYEINLLDHEFDSKSHTSKTKTQDELHALDIKYSDALKPISNTNTNLRELSEYINSFDPQIKTILSTLQAFHKSFAKDMSIEQTNKLFEHVFEVSDLFKATNQRNEELFYNLEKEIQTASDDLKRGVKEAEMNLTFLKDNAKFTSEIATIFIELQELARSLRDERKSETKTEESYSAKHFAASTLWKTLNDQIKPLNETFKGIKKEFSEFMTKSTEILKQKSQSQNIEDLLDQQSIKDLQTRFKEKDENLSRYWESKIPAISKIAAQELNRGIQALRESAQSKDFKNAFSSETSFLIADTASKATALLPQFLTSWSTTQEEEPITYYQSAFDTLN